jgi:acetolactate synthase-1/2/3 large subunit
MNGASVVLNVLKRHGVRHVFGVPGAQVGGLMDGVSRDDHFTYIICRHEEAAAHMAHGVGRARGALALCFGTTGPGATNMVSAVQSAAMDHVPLLVITANNPDDQVYPFKDCLQDSDNAAIYGAITKFSARVASPGRLEELLERAIYAAQSGQPGPAHLDIPVNFLYHDHVPSRPTFSGTLPHPPAASERALDEVLRCLGEARRPVLLLGAGVNRAGACDVARQVVEALSIPVTTTVNGRGAINTDSSLCFGTGGLYGGVAYETALKQSDLVLAVGCKFGSFSLLARSPDFEVDADKKIVHVDIDSDVIGRNTPVDVGIVADARLFLEGLLQRATGFAAPDWSRWIAELAGKRDEHGRAVTDAIGIAEESADALPQARVVAALEKHMPGNAMVAIDGGQVAMWVNTLFRPRDDLSLVYTTGTGHLGSGLPLAMGLALNRPDRPAYVITGDGAFAFTMQELATCAKYRIPVISIVLHDACWGIYNRFKGVFDNENWGSELSRIDFCRVAEGLGVPSSRVTRLEDIPAVLEKAGQAGGPYVIEVPVTYQLNPVNQYLGPATMPGVRIGQTPMALTD